MRDVLSELLESWNAGETVGMATVVQTSGSAPRPPGASMLVAANGAVAGSVSGGCVEGALYELAAAVSESGIPELKQFGYSDDEAFAVGLTCGGTIDVFVEPVSRLTFPELGDITEHIRSGRPVAMATVIEHPEVQLIGRRLIVYPGSVEGTLGSARMDGTVADDVTGLLASGSTSIRAYGPEGERMGTGMRVFVASYQPRPRMIIFGAIDFAAALARQGSFLGYHVTVCDARSVFATESRFPGADEVVVSWPHRYLERELDAGRIDHRAAICVLTHDPKFDVPVLDLVLRLEDTVRPAFVGAMGSRVTHEKRLNRLRESGLDDGQLSRLSSPIGLDLGGRTPEETAVSIAAEIIALRWDGSGARLGGIDSPVHHRTLHPGGRGSPYR